MWLKTCHGQECIMRRFFKWYYSESNVIGATDRNWTLGLCSHHDLEHFHSYNDLEETFNHLNSLKLNKYAGDIISYWCAEILVDAEQLDIAGSFKPNQLGYINHIFEDNWDFIFSIWGIHNYKEVMYFIKNTRVFDLGVIKPEDLITYMYLAQ